MHFIEGQVSSGGKSAKIQQWSFNYIQHQYVALSAYPYPQHEKMVDLLTKSPWVALRSEGKLHLVDLAGSECAKKGGLIYSEDIGRSGAAGGGSTSWRKIDGTWDISGIS
jgi:hypothetical protein